MREDVRQALAIDSSSTMEDRTIGITTTGRRSGRPRRIEIVFYRLGDDIYLSGVPAATTRNWLANLAAHAQFTFHLKHDVVADLPATATATATVIVEPAERQRVPPLSSRSSTVATVRTVRGRRPFSTNGWNTARWRRSLSKSDLIGPISCFKPRFALVDV